MIPQQNTSHVVLSFPTERIDDLIVAMQSAGILPRKYPADGSWDVLEIPIARLDLGFRIRFRLEIGFIGFDAIQENPENEFRMGADVTLIDTFLEAYELSTNQTLASLEFLASGRVAIDGSLEVRPGDKAVFFVLREVMATPDDTSAGLPNPWPDLDLEKILERVSDRAIRAQLNATAPPPERMLPIDPQLDTTSFINFPLLMNYICREPVAEVDWLSHSVCLPTGLGDPACDAGPGSQTTFLQRLDVYAAPASAPVPVPVNPIDHRQFQIDIGIDLLRAALAEKANDPSWSGQPRFLMYRFDYGLRADIVAWPGTTDDEVCFWFELHGTQQIWYPKVETCQGWTDTPFGRVYFDYPCGVEDGWLDVDTITVTTMFRLRSSGDGTLICVDRNGPTYSSDPNLWGELYEYIMESLIAIIPIIGPIVATGMEVVDMVWFFVSIIAEFVARLIDAVLPGQLCFPIGRTFAKLPLLDDRIDVALSNAYLEMKTNGITIAFDGEFEKR